MLLIVDLHQQGRQTRQNSGGVADLTKGGGLQKVMNFYAIKISTFWRFYVKRLKKAYILRIFAH